MKDATSTIVAANAPQDSYFQKNKETRSALRRVLKALILIRLVNSAGDAPKAAIPALYGRIVRFVQQNILTKSSLIEKSLNLQVIALSSVPPATTMPETKSAGHVRKIVNSAPRQESATYANLTPSRKPEKEINQMFAKLVSLIARNVEPQQINARLAMEDISKLKALEMLQTPAIAVQLLAAKPALQP